MNKIEFFAESSEAPSELPEWLKINSDTEKYLSFSFNEVYTEKEEVINPETGDKEEQEVTKKRMFMFEGKKEITQVAVTAILLLLKTTEQKLNMKWCWTMYSNRPISDISV